MSASSHSNASSPVTVTLTPANFDALRRRIDASNLAVPADTRFTGGIVADVYTGEFVKGVDVLVKDGLVAAVVPEGIGEARETVDLQGKTLLPAFIDAHVHIESAMLVPERFAELVVPHGTGAVVADPHEIANVLGTVGLDFMLEASEGLPLDIRFQLPSCVPATPFEHAGAVLDAAALEPYWEKKRVLGLGEVMNIPGVLGHDPDLAAKLLHAQKRRRPIDGHAPGILHEARSATAAAGITTDHECSTLEEMRESLARGMKVIIREGSAAKNLRTLIQGVTPRNSRRCMFCSDDVNPADVERLGHMEKHLRMAVEAGVDPMTAVQMATLNAAEHFGLPGGAIAPGKPADFAVVEDVTTFRVAETWHRGELVAKDGKLTKPIRTPIQPEAVLSRVKLQPVGLETFRLPVPSGEANVIGIVPHEIVTKAEVRTVATDAKGNFDASLNPGLVKLAVLERHHALGTVGLGILSGYVAADARMDGAVATTIAHDSHNIVCAGGSDADMLAAVRALEALGGGMVVVKRGEVVASLALPAGGLMSFEPADAVARGVAAVLRAAEEALHLGEGLEPVMTLAFLALPVIPELRLTDLGLFDVRAWSHVGTDRGAK